MDIEALRVSSERASTRRSILLEALRDIPTEEVPEVLATARALLANDQVARLAPPSTDPGDLLRVLVSSTVVDSQLVELLVMARREALQYRQASVAMSPLRRSATAALFDQPPQDSSANQRLADEIARRRRDEVKVFASKGPERPAVLDTHSAFLDVLPWSYYWHCEDANAADIRLALVRIAHAVEEIDTRERTSGDGLRHFCLKLSDRMVTRNIAVSVETAAAVHAMLQGPSNSMTSMAYLAELSLLVDHDLPAGTLQRMRICRLVPPPTTKGEHAALARSSLPISERLLPTRAGNHQSGPATSGQRQQYRDTPSVPRTCMYCSQPHVGNWSTHSCPRRPTAPPTSAVKFPTCTKCGKAHAATVACF